MQANDCSQDIENSSSRQTYFFYRLKNEDEQQTFKQSDLEIECPICGKVQKNIEMLFKNSKKCEEKIDIDHFMTMYQVISSYARKQYRKG